MCRSTALVCWSLERGNGSSPTWLKLHLAVDADTGMIVAQILTDQNTDDPSQVEPLVAQVEQKISKLTADGAYDSAPTYQTIAQHDDDILLVIPPRRTGVLDTQSNALSQRGRHIEMITTAGRLARQKAAGYGQRAPVETTMGRYKSIIGHRLKSSGFEAQKTEAAIGVAVLKRMLAAGRPNSVRSQKVAA